MKIRAFILTLLVALVLCGPALAQSGDPPAQQLVVLTDGQGRYPLGLHMELLEDPSGALTIDEVSSPAFDARFTPSQVEAPNFGFTDSASWVRLQLLNDSRTTERWLLEVHFANMQFVDLYTPLPDGEGFVVKESGTLRPPASRDVRYPRIILNLSIPTQSVQTYYLRFKNGASMTLPLILWSPDAFLLESSQELLRYGIFLGILLGILAFHLFLLFSLPNANYAYFTIFLANMVFFEAVYAGFAETYLIPRLYALKPYYQPLSFALVLVSVLLFTNSFLEVKARNPKLRLVNIAILGVWGVLVLLIPFSTYHSMALLMVPWALLSTASVLATGVVSLRQGFRPARFFIFALLGLAGSLSITFLVRLGVIVSTSYTESIYRVGIVGMALCWSFALADHINLLKAETEDAYGALRRSEHQLIEILDGLPIGVAVYGKDQKPTYINRRTLDFLNNPARGIHPDVAAGRTLAQAIRYYSLYVAGTDREYPLEDMPIYRALRGEPSSVDDLEVERESGRVPLELWASPVRDDAGNVDSAVAAFQDITQRRAAEAELQGHRLHLEELVRQRTAQLGAVNELLRAEIDERKQLEAMLQIRLDWLVAVNLVNQSLARSMAQPADFAQSFDLITDIINRLLATENCFIGEFDDGDKNLKILAHSCRSDSHAEVVGSLTSLPDSVRSDPNIEQGRLGYFPKEELSAISGPMGTHLQATEIPIVALVPLLLREETFGFLGLEIHEGERTLSREEETLLEIFAFDIASLIEDARLFEQTRALITAEERNRLARDLHDSVTQVLFSASLVAETLPRTWQRNPERALQSLENLRRLTRGALAEMRTLLLELRPSAVIHTPLAELLAQLTEATTTRGGLQAQLFIEPIPSLPENVHTSFYRIAQEALNNVAKHAQAKTVTVSLSATPVPDRAAGPSGHQVRLVIQDDGVGFTAGVKPSHHLGIGIMQERAAAVGATLALQSQPGHGTQMTLIWVDESGDGQ